MGQLALDFDRPQASPQARAQTIQGRFEAWLQLNAETYAAFARAARRLRERGLKRIGSKLICEEMRHDVGTQPTRTDAYKINNDFTSRLARKLLEDDPSFAGLIELRAIKSK